MCSELVTVCVKGPTYSLSALGVVRTVGVWGLLGVSEETDKLLHYM